MPFLIPPKHLRVWVGPFEDKELYLGTGRREFDFIMKHCDLKRDDKILDIGCGCGRISIYFLDYLNSNGSYAGIDPALPLINWCKENIEPRYSNCRIEHVDILCPGINDEGKIRPEDFQFPFENHSFDKIVLNSLFTHMKDDGVRQYLREINRVLSPNGMVFVTFFMLNENSIKSMKKGQAVFDFKYDYGNYKSFHSSRPEEGIAYDEAFVKQMIKESGLHIKYPIHYGTWIDNKNNLYTQDNLVLSKQ
jgi:cyclopropane fatty-acyl-phospholipid synthase-like methyltransferase